MNIELRGRVGVIGDVHAEDRLLEAALGELQDAGITRVLCTGDIADGPGDVGRCCAQLMTAGVLAVRGNHDRWLLTDTMRRLSGATRLSEISPSATEFLTGLPRTRRMSSDLGGVMLCHGLGVNDMASVSPDDFGYALETNDDLQALLSDPGTRIVFNGHTHVALVLHLDRLTVVNAGTLSQQHEPGYLVADFDVGDVGWHGLGPSSGQLRRLGSLFR